MIRPNYKNYIGSNFIVGIGGKLVHSAKGSTWEDHKYIKRIDGTYYYPDNYVGGRHLPDSEKDQPEQDSDRSSDLSDADIENLAKEVIRGNFGNGEQRRTLLAENYERIQKRVNEILKGDIGSKEVIEVSEEVIKKVEEIAKNISSASSDPNVHSGVDMEQVQNVYKIYNGSNRSSNSKSYIEPNDLLKSYLEWKKKIGGDSK